MRNWLTKVHLEPRLPLSRTEKCQDQGI